MKYFCKIKAFTLVELLVTISVAAVLVSVAAVSYSNAILQSRDAKRKGDLEEIRASLEQFRSTNSYYPQVLSEIVPNYIQRLPSDPLAGSGYSYQYSPIPLGCNNSGGLCTDYTLGALLEKTNTCSSPPSSTCRNGAPCNYCLSPLGERGDVAYSNPPYSNPAYSNPVYSNPAYSNPPAAGSSPTPTPDTGIPPDTECYNLCMSAEYGGAYYGGGCSDPTWCTTLGGDTIIPTSCSPAYPCCCI